MESALGIDLPRVASDLNLDVGQVQRTVALLDDGNTIPFITRYRKEQTGNLDEVQIREIQSRVTALRQLAERAQTIVRLIENQGRMTEDLRKAILSAPTLKHLEDLYLPFRPKRRSRAQTAREAGLEPLADRIWTPQGDLHDLSRAAADFLNPDASINDVDAALQGASDILAERISEQPDVRNAARRVAWKTGRLNIAPTKTAAETGREFQDYFDYSERVAQIPPHRALAINRGEKQGALRVRFEWDDDQALHGTLQTLNLQSRRFPEFLQRCAVDALSRLIQPSLEREVRRELTERAAAHAVAVFARNLRALLLQPPLAGERVLAIDPGFRTGCKIVVLDERGNCLTHDLVYVTGNEEKRAANSAKLLGLVQQYDCRLIAIGNGTACRETEELVSDMIAASGGTYRYIIVNEAGASIYSTSTVAREELPDLDATVRGTISIGRRLQDPLSELVKIEPQHIGVGMYQHDVSARQLQESLEQVVESCVNFVGVDVNTASASLLTHVSGLNQLIARRVVEWRATHGPFRNRRQLRDVTGVGDVTFTQAAGFLKITDGDEPLDSTWIHPESYAATYKLLEQLDMSAEELVARDQNQQIREKLGQVDVVTLARDLEIGPHTLRDVIEALERPGRDPRTELPGPVFKQGVLKLEDLVEGMELTGTVLNVVDFGAFVDIGLKDSGLVHISKMAQQFVSNPHEIVSVGDIVKVWVLSIDTERRRVSLSMVRPDELASRDAPDAAARRKSGSRETQSASGRTARPSGKAERTEHAGSTGRSRPSAEPRAADSASESLPEEGEPLRGFDQLKQHWDSRRR